MSISPATAHWFKSSRSDTGGKCVEIAFLDDTIGVRDSKDPTGPVLTFHPTAWDAFLEGLSK